MAEQGFHRILEARLEALGDRIDTLRHKMARSQGREKIEAFGEVDELERRYKTLGTRLQALNSEGAGFRQDAKAEVENLADDLSGAVEEFTLWVDRGCRPDLRPKSGGKS
jgi:predicted  nucleic acid-binding Zn-ribbon protein